jgi:outer membrane protein assembly factor BamB
VYGARFTTWRAVRVGAAAVACLAAAACTTGSATTDDRGPVTVPNPPAASSPHGRPVPLTAVDWPTYHHDAARSGYTPSVPALRHLNRAWAATLDGPVYAQPLVIAGNVIAATENNTLYAVDAATGRERWRTHVGTPVRLSTLPCGNIDPLGITGTPAYDPGTGRVFAVAEISGRRHVLVGVDVATGRVEVRTPLEPPGGSPGDAQQRAAVALVGNRVYVAYGGLYGDCGQYLGGMASLRTDGTGRAGWAVPTAQLGGIWTPGGPAVRAGSLYVSIGNGAATSGTYDGSDSITRLSADLQRRDFFAPRQWAQDNTVDADLGSMGAALVGNRVVVAGKSGIAYLLDAEHLGGVGGQLATVDLGCRGFGAAAVVGSTAYLPCLDGVREVTVRGSALIPGWRGPAAATGPPVVGGGAVYSIDRDTGTLYALDPVDGRILASDDVGSVEHFASPALSGARVFVPTSTGVVALRTG